MTTILKLKLQTKFKMKKMKKTYRILVVVFMVVGFSACMVGPNYQKPEIVTPENYRYSTHKDTIHDLVWRDIFKDPVLIQLIDSALVNNFDAQIAAIAKSAGAGIATRNVPDFEGCGIKVVDPWQS